MELQYKPNFFIVGMPRSGSTSMYTYLKQHPDVFVSIYKEPHFFCKDLHRPNFIQDEEMYYNLFVHAGNKKRIGEASVWYLTSGTAAVEIKQFNPVAKIIIMLRNPINMIYSLHSLFFRTNNEDIADFQEALTLQQARMMGKFIPETCTFPWGLFYTEVGKYYEKIKRFVDVFGTKVLHFVIFDDFVADTAGCYREVLEFLEIDPGFKAEFDLEKASQVVRPIALRQIRDAHPLIREKLTKKIGKLHKSPPRTPLPPLLRLRLQTLFKDDIEKTSRLIDRDLTGWCSGGEK